MLKPPIICDTTLWLYLGRIHRIELLSSLFAPIYVSEAVLLELDMGRFLRADTLDPRALTWATQVDVTPNDFGRLPLNRLGIGERATIAYANTHPGTLTGLDDFQARLLAESLDLHVIGTPGVLLRAKRAGLLLAVRPELEALLSQGFRLSPDLYLEVLKLAEES